jgi:hypothetical protein
LHLYHQFLARYEYLFFLVEFFPRDSVHGLNAAPAQLHLFFELVDAGVDFTQDVIGFALDVVLELLKLFAQEFYFAC